MTRKILTLTLFVVVGLMMTGCYQRTVDSEGIGSDRRTIYESNLPPADDGNQEVFEEVHEMDPVR